MRRPRGSYRPWRWSHQLVSPSIAHRCGEGNPCRGRDGHRSGRRYGVQPRLAPPLRDPEGLDVRRPAGVPAASLGLACRVRTTVRVAQAEDEPPGFEPKLRAHGTAGEDDPLDDCRVIRSPGERGPGELQPQWNELEPLAWMQERKHPQVVPEERIHRIVVEQVAEVVADRSAVEPL